ADVAANYFSPARAASGSDATQKTFRNGRELSRQFHVTDAKDGAPGFVCEACDIPTVGEDDLLDDSKAQASPGLLSGEIGFEDFGTTIGRNSGTVVANFEQPFVSTALLGKDLNFPCAVDGLNRIQEQIEKGLTQELFIGLNAELLALNLQADMFF